MINPDISRGSLRRLMSSYNSHLRKNLQMCVSRILTFLGVGLVDVFRKGAESLEPPKDDEIALHFQQEWNVEKIRGITRVMLFCLR